MRRLINTICTLLITIPFGSIAQSATEIVRLADEKMRGKSTQAEMIIRTVRPSWSREMKIKTWMQDHDFAMILILTPAREKGITFLKRKKEVWNWLPALERIIKLPPSMMNQSWMGTDFTNDDLVKESSVIDDYTHNFAADTVLAGRSCYQIRFIPKPTTAVVWGKLIVCIDKENLIELRTDFFDEDGKLINRMVASDIRLMDGRLLPTKFEMIPADKPEQKTEIIYEKILFNRSVRPDFFSIENMKRLH